MKHTQTHLVVFPMLTENNIQVYELALIYAHVYVSRPTCSQSHEHRDGRKHTLAMPLSMPEGYFYSGSFISIHFSKVMVGVAWGGERDNTPLPEHK